MMRDGDDEQPAPEAPEHDGDQPFPVEEPPVEAKPNSHDEAPPVAPIEKPDLVAAAMGLGLDVRTAPAINQPECGNCRFWLESKRSIAENAKPDLVRGGLCRRHAPHVYPVQIIPNNDPKLVLKPGQIPPNIVTQTWSLFPDTRSTIWCGEHEPVFEQ